MLKWELWTEWTMNIISLRMNERMFSRSLVSKTTDGDSEQWFVFWTDAGWLQRKKVVAQIYTVQLGMHRPVDGVSAMMSLIHIKYSYITSTKDVFGLVCLSVCQQDYGKSYRIFWWNGVAWAKEEPNSLWSGSKSQSGHKNYYYRPYKRSTQWGVQILNVGRTGPWYCISACQWQIPWVERDNVGSVNPYF